MSKGRPRFTTIQVVVEKLLRPAFVGSFRQVLPVKSLDHLACSNRALKRWVRLPPIVPDGCQFECMLKMFGQCELPCNFRCIGSHLGGVASNRLPRIETQLL